MRTRECTRDGCTAPVVGRKLCRRHYQAAWKAGEFVNAPLPPRVAEVAHCKHCGWFLDIEHWGDEGAWVKYTPEEIIDACAEHNRPRHTSHWGESHEIGDHDALVAKQAKRRAKYLAGKAVAA